MTHAVLVIDDDQHVLQSLTRSLRRDGYEMHLAANGQEALQILGEKQIAVVICDQRMPGMSGAETLAGAAELSPDSYRIALTGYADVSAIGASINEGKINHLLLKPWEDDHLRSVVREGVRAYQLVQENRRLEVLTRRQKEELEAWSQQLEGKVQAQTAELSAQNANLRDLQSSLEQSLRDIVELLASLLEAYSPNLGIHSMRVAKLALCLGERLGLAGEELRNVEIAAYLHDIGKISDTHEGATREAGRRGTRGLRSSTWHPDAGYSILSHVSGFQDIAWAVQYQSERYDGSGFPDGLRGEDIPLNSRIITVVNAYDQAVFLHSIPPSREAGRRILLEGRGTHFDPQLVALLLECVDKEDKRISKHTEVELSPHELSEGMVLSRDVTAINGVLLLKSGIGLTAQHITKVRAYGAADALLSGVFVRCDVPSEHLNDRGASKRRGRQENIGRESNIPEAPEMVDFDQQPLSPVSSPAANASPDSSGDPPEVSESTPSAPATDLTGARILIVDDCRLTCMALSRDVRRAGFVGVAANTGAEAIDLIEHGDFELALIDLAMPTMPGTELVQRLQECAPAMPCLILTGHATTESVLELAGAPNIAGILVKPWDHDRLISTIVSAIAERKEEHV